MSNYLADRIKKPRYSMLSTNAVKERYKFIVGFDSEADTTSDGRPMLFQFSRPDQSEEDTDLVILDPTPHAGLRAFLDFIDRYCTDAKVEYLIYVWNLTYELTQIFHDIPNRRIYPRPT